MRIKTLFRSANVAAVMLCALCGAAGATEESAKAYETANKYLNGEILPPRADISYDGDPIKIRFTIFTPENAKIISDVIRKAFGRLEAESNGKLVGEIFWNGSVHGPRDGFKAVRSGISDLSSCYVAYNPSAFKLFHVSGLPGIYPDAPVGSLALARVYKKYLRDEYEKQGVYLGRLTMTPQYNLVSKDVVKELNDLHGMPVRSGGGMQSKIIEALGAVPVSVPVSEAYTAFQRGTVEGVMSHDAGFVSYRTGEIAAGHLDLGMGGISTEYCLRKEFFDGLPPDLQGVLADWLQRWALVEAILYFEQGAELARDKLVEWDVEMNELGSDGKAELQAISKGVVEAFIEDNEEADSNAAEMVAEIRKLVEAYKGQSWNELLLQTIENPVRLLDTGAQ